MLKVITLSAIAACLQLATLQPAAAKSPFCFGGSPASKHICDTIKAAEKKNKSFASGTLANPPSRAVRRPR